MNSKHFTPCMLLLVVLATGPSARHAAAITNEKTTTREPVPKGSPAQGSVDLAGFAVRKGDAREPVMRRLSKLYELQKLRSADSEEDAWLISEKKQTNNYIGVVSFASGRVRRVARFRKWTQDDDSVELAQRLCDLLENLTAERGNSANIEARSTDSGAVSVRGVELVFGDKRVSFNVVSRNDTDGKQKEVHLGEVIQ
jgi:hypothetical protein